MRTLSLRLTAAITGRRPKPPIPDEDLAAIKEQARQLLEQSTHMTPEPNPANLATPTPRPSPRPLRPMFSFGPPPQPDYVPEQSRIQPVVKYPLFGTQPTGEKRPGPALLPPFATPWDVAWARLTDAERAWSSQP